MEQDGQVVALLQEIRDGQRVLVEIQQANAVKYEKATRQYALVSRIAIVVLVLVILAGVLSTFPR